MVAQGKVPDEFVVAVLPRNAIAQVARGQLRTLRRASTSAPGL